MQSVAIFPVQSDDGGQSFRAVSKAGQSEGRTVGEALDGVAPSLPPGTSGTVVVIQPMIPDALFTAEQRSRLETLMAAWRAARDAGQGLSKADSEELQTLVDAELAAAARRSREMLQGLQP
jgi:hypothetical protein